MGKRRVPILLGIACALLAVLWAVAPSQASTPTRGGTAPSTVAAAAPHMRHGRVTNAARKAAAARAMAIRAAAAKSGRAPLKATLNPAAIPDYFGNVPNFANSPLPAGPIGSITVLERGKGYGTSVKVKIGDIFWGSGKGATARAKVVNGRIVSIRVVHPGRNYTDPTVTISGSGNGAQAMAILNSKRLKGGIRKFVDSLPGLGRTGKNDLGQYIPVAIPDTTTFPGSDYYEIALIQFKEKMAKDLPATTFRGYVQVETAANAGQSKHIPLTYPNGAPILNGAGNQVFAVDPPQYAGPTIVATSNRPVRVKFTNYLPTGAAGNLFLPVDSTIMGAGMGPNGGEYTQNRATLHLHGGATPWISDGTPYQWTAAVGDSTTYQRGASVQFVPDMWFDPATHQVVPAGTAGATNDPGPGSLTLYYTNQQSARLMFYHDHADGITRLNVYAGEVAPYVLQDQIEQDFIKRHQRIRRQRHACQGHPRDRDTAGHPRQDLRAEDHAARERRSHLERGPVGRHRQPLAAARLHAEPESLRRRGRERHGPLGLQLVVLPAPGASDLRAGSQPAGRHDSSRGAAEPGHSGRQGRRWNDAVHRARVVHGHAGRERCCLPVPQR